MPSYLPGTETRSRLLMAAAEVFAEQGFRHARISDICQRAQANIAAVNYHFGDKEQLYMEVIRKLNEEAQADATYLQVVADATPEDKLRKFIKDFMFILLTTGPSTWLGKIMAREMIEPTAALDFMVEHVIHPVHETVCGIIGELLRRAPEDRMVDLCVSSVLSQCMIFFDTKEIALRMNPEFINPDGTYEPAIIDFLAEHITRFSLQGMGAFSDANPETSVK